ncbi:NUDIX hydrolase [Mucilaginibacter paludis]|uniref:NUDIX hydrolase n=1 Tax=Mucilaginibacter paludis DSM 18603 TaxID=714943 RepID=H1Y3S4_9SPHI|nr:NUDIX domain-containing protein [Mucilaginibacter paludis]EHQ30336.1 NUDIX hydrolase [Mucilaginibacter paludis DSM 18603]
MAQIYRIYINQKTLLITESIPANLTNFQQIEHQSFDLKIIYPLILEHYKGYNFFVICNDARAFFKKITKAIPVIEAAGGLVKNERKEYLFIYRNDKWDLPKGKIEKGEKVKEAAVREVEEECGITVKKLGKRICKTYHAYIYRGEVVLKKTYWFKMKCEGQEKLKPQKEEGITDARWFVPEKMNVITKNTFPSILEVMETVELVKDKAKLP